MPSSADPARNQTSTFGRSLDRAAWGAFALLVGAAPLLHGGLEGLPRLILRLGVVAAVALCAAAVVARGPHRRLPALPASLLAVYLAFLLAATTRVADTFAGEQALLDALVAASGFPLGASLAATRARKLGVVCLFLTGATVSAALVWFQLQGAGWLPPTTRGRVSGLFENPNYLAGLLDMAAPLALAATLLAAKWWIRLAAGIAAAVLYAAAGMTFSYGGWSAAAIGTAAVLVAWAVRGWRRRTFLLPLLGAFGIALAVASGALALLATSPRLEGTLTDRIGAVATLDRLSSARSRIAIQTAALELSLDHPLLGVGPGAFTDAIVAYRPERVDEPGEALLHRTLVHAMSDILNVAVASGIPGAAAFVLFWLVVLVRAPPGTVAVRVGIVSGLLAVTAHGLVDGNLTVVTANAFVAFALAGVLHAPASAGALHSRTRDRNRRRRRTKRSAHVGAQPSEREVGSDERR